MEEKIYVLNHSSVKLMGEKVIYVDPYDLSNATNDADYIFITHSHYDHFSPEDILKIAKENTKLVVTEDLYAKSRELGFKKENILSVLPNNNYQIDGIKFITIPSYNNLKPFHPKKNNWVGYLIEINAKTYYIMGDTDKTLEAEKVKCDVLFIPVGGTYTMNYKEAAEVANYIKPNLVVPIHYGSVVGTKKDAEEFTKLLKGVDYKILL